MESAKRSHHSVFAGFAAAEVAAPTPSHRSAEGGSEAYPLLRSCNEHQPRTYRRIAQRDAATRHRRLHRADRRSALVRIPAGTLASARMAVGFHRFGWHAGGDAAIRGAVDRLALLLASRTPTRRQRRGTGEVERAAHARTRGVALRTRARRRQGRVRGRHAVVGFGTFPAQAAGETRRGAGRG